MSLFPACTTHPLLWRRSEVWANVWYQDFIVRINPATGTVLGVIDMQGIRKTVHPHEDCLNGIAWDPETDRLWVTGKRWNNVFEIEVLERTPPSL